MNRTSRRGLLIFAFAVLTTLVAAGAVVGFLLSASGGAFLLSQAQSTLMRNWGVQVEFSQGQLYLMHGFQFRDLRVEIHRPDLEAAIRIPAVDVSYTLGIFSRHLIVDHALVDHPRIKLLQRHSSQPVPKGGAPSGSFAELIHRPPLQITLQKLSVKGLELFASQKSENQQNIDFELKGADLSLALDFIADKLAMMGELDFGKGGGLHLASPSPAWETGFQFSGKGSWKTSVVRAISGTANKPWQYDFLWKDFHFQIRDFIYSQGSLRTIKSPVVAVRADGTLKARGFDSGEVSELEQVQIQGNLESTGLEMSGSQKGRIAKTSMDFSSTLDDQLRSEMSTHLQKAELKGYLARALDGDWTAEFHSSRDLSRFDLSSVITLAKSQVAELKARGERTDGSTSFSGHAKLQSSVALARQLPSFAILRQQPQAQVDFDGDFQGKEKAAILHIHSKSNIQLENGRANIQLTEKGSWHPDRRLLEMTAEALVTEEAYGKWLAKSNLQVESEKALRTKGQTQIERQAAGKTEWPFTFQGAITVEHDVNLDPSGRKEVRVSGVIPSVILKDGSKFSDTKWNASVHTLDDSGKNIELSASLNQGPIRLASVAARSNAGNLSGLNAEIKGTLKDGVLALPHISLNLDHSLITLKGDAAGNLTNKDFQLHSDIFVRFPENFPRINGHALTGAMEIPITLTVSRAREITFQSNLRFQDLTWRKPDNGSAVIQITGRVPLAERLIWDGQHVRFAELISGNPFERVDFNRVRPLLRGSEQLRVEKIQWQDKAYGPFVGFFSLRQNRLSVHQFDMDLIGGRVYGELFFNIHPANIQAGFLGRLTNLNLTEFLPSVYTAGNDSRARDLSARAGLVFNLNRSTLDGRVDITEIGGRQLSALINTLDPNFRDEKMNKIRSLLQVGYPTAVNASLAEGYMNMDVQLNLLSVMTRESVHGIPLSGFISKASAGIREQIRKGALQ